MSAAVAGKEECPQEWGHGSLKGYATQLRHRVASTEARA
jgi:hypothetical protein